MRRRTNWILLIIWELIIIFVLLGLTWPHILRIWNGIQEARVAKERQFIDVFKTSGIEKMAFARGASWTDFNNDGLLDIFLVGGVDGSLLYKNEGGSFKDVSPKEFRALGKKYAGIFADYDNDGCQDLYVAGYSTGDYLYKGDCDGGFLDVTEKSGLKRTTTGTGAAWADYDNDGLLDLYIAAYGLLDPQGNRFSYMPNILYKNNGDGTFKDVTKNARVEGLTTCMFKNSPNPQANPSKRAFQPVWFDYDDDGLIDLFVSTDVGISPLYKNNGDGTFKDVTKEAGLCIKGTNMGVAVGDYDNDLDFDFYTTNVGKNYFWQNNSNKTFTLLTGGDETSDIKSIGWGAGFFDYDNDGHLDLYIANGATRKLEGQGDTTGVISEDKLYENMGNKKFKEVSKREGIFGNDRKVSVAFGDFNADGYTDIFVVPVMTEDGPAYRLYENRGSKNNWISIKLVGRKSNRDSIGAKIIVRADGKKQSRIVSAGSSFASQDSLWQIIGVGESEIVDTISIRWPSGETKSVSNVKVNQKIIIEEP